MDSAEREIRHLLKLHGEYKRSSKKRHEIWVIPHGGQFTLATNHSVAKSKNKWKNALADLKRLIRKAQQNQMSLEPMKEPAVLVNIKKAGEIKPIYAVPNVEPLKDNITKKVENIVAKKPDNNKLSWTEDEDKILAEAVTEGSTDAEIAEILETRTRAAVGARRQVLGIKKYKSRTDHTTRNTVARPAPQKPTPNLIPPSPPQPKPQVVLQPLPMQTAPTTRYTTDNQPKASTSGYVLIIRMPDKSECSVPITKQKAEEYALKIIAGDL